MLFINLKVRPGCCLLDLFLRKVNKADNVSERVNEGEGAGMRNKAGEGER